MRNVFYVFGRSFTRTGVCQFVVLLPQLYSGIVGNLKEGCAQNCRSDTFYCNHLKYCTISSTCACVWFWELLLTCAWREDPPHAFLSGGDVTQRWRRWKISQHEGIPFLRLGVEVTQAEPNRREIPQRQNRKALLADAALRRRGPPPG